LRSNTGPSISCKSEKKPSTSSVEEDLGCSGGRPLSIYSILLNSLDSRFATRPTITSRVSPHMPLIDLITKYFSTNFSNLYMLLLDGDGDILEGELHVHVLVEKNILN
jgi:hypothetical protein